MEDDGCEDAEEADDDFTVKGCTVYIVQHVH